MSPFSPQICGYVIFAVGIYLKMTKDGNQLTNFAHAGVDLMIAIGTIIMVLGFLGCYGAYRESSCMLLIFFILLLLTFILLLLIFILRLAAGILGALSEKTVNDWVKKRLQDFTPLTKQPESVKQDLEALQAKLKCCGIINGPGDWEKPPPSCYCRGTDTTDCKSGIQNTPCSTKIIDLMQQNMQVVLGISFAIAPILIFGMIFSMMIYCQIPNRPQQAAINGTGSSIQSSKLTTKLRRTRAHCSASSDYLARKALLTRTAIP
ncbi:tetraspanin-8-like, partial [Oryzias melastigma]|uniref:tetraspanin-8-like n=1 Tax=Oryzias melastigma TaxID=30732 RepID=UPI00168D8ADB